MSLQTLKNLMSKRTASQRGFTIVELLIVIVVIGILATITIVAYNGIQNKSKTTVGGELASNISKKMEAYNAVVGSYPGTPKDVQSQKESKIDNLSLIHI